MISTYILPYDDGGRGVVYLGTIFPLNCAQGSPSRGATMRYVIAVLAVTGIAVSTLALISHFGSPADPLDLLNSNWNSAYVNQSSYAEVSGIPAAVLGIVGYTLLAILALLRHTVLTVYMAGAGLVLCALFHGRPSAHSASVVPVSRVVARRDVSDSISLPCGFGLRRRSGREPIISSGPMKYGKV